MAREGAQEKISSGREEFKRFEEEAAERHREQVLEELGQKLEEMDRKASGELLASGRYIEVCEEERGKERRTDMGAVEAVQAEETGRKCLCFV